MRPKYIIATVATLLLSLSTTTVTAQTSGISCNGNAALCSKSYQEVAYATTHNAYAVGKTVAANQLSDIPTQLKDGIRAFMLDAHNPSDGTQGVELCHQSCSLLDGGSLLNTLQQMVTFLKANPNEVITILWENFGKIAPSRFATVYQQSGIMSYVFNPAQDPSQEWPTLQEMITSGKRVVNFIDTGADQSVPWLMPEYTYVFETPFENYDATKFACTIDRPAGQKRSMYVLNHFLYGKLPAGISSGGQSVDIPQRDTANTTNSQNLASHADRCKTTFGSIPNFVTVDFYDKGVNNVNVLSVVAGLNGVPYTPKAIGTPVNTSNGGSGSGSSSSISGTSNANLRVSLGLLQTMSALGFVAIFAVIRL